MRPFFKDDDFNFLTEIALGSVFRQAGHQPGQRAILAGTLPGTVRQAHRQKAIVAFTEAEGADSHCEPAASGIRGERIFDWLDEQIPA